MEEVTFKQNAILGDKELQVNLKNIDPEGVYILDIARALNLSSDDKFNFIFTKPPEQQENFLLMQMRCTIKLREQEKKLNNDFSLN